MVRVRRNGKQGRSGVILRNNISQDHPTPSRFIPTSRPLIHVKRREDEDDGADSLNIMYHEALVQTHGRYECTNESDARQ